MIIIYLNNSCTDSYERHDTFTVRGAASPPYMFRSRGKREKAHFLLSNGLYNDQVCQVKKERMGFKNMEKILFP